MWIVWPSNIEVWDEVIQNFTSSELYYYDHHHIEWWQLIWKPWEWNIVHSFINSNTKCQMIDILSKILKTIDRRFNIDLRLAVSFIYLKIPNFSNSKIN